MLQTQKPPFRMTWGYNTLLGVALASTIPPLLCICWLLLLRSLGLETSLSIGVLVVVFFWAVAGLFIGTACALWLTVASDNPRWLLLTIPGLIDGVLVFVALQGLRGVGLPG